MTWRFRLAKADPAERIGRVTRSGVVTSRLSIRDAD
jgi:hypothetical protein